MKLPTWLRWGAKNTISSPQDILRELMVEASTKSGVRVTWKTALQSAVALACGRVIAEGLAQVPFKVFLRRPDDRGADVTRDHPLFTLVARKPNQWQTSYEFREQIGLHLAFFGNAYIFIVRGIGDIIIELLPFEPQLVTVKRLPNHQRVYTIWVDNKEMVIPERDMWHIKGLTWDAVTGLEGIELAKEAIGIAMGLEEHTARLFSNGSQPGGLLTTDAVLDEQQAKALREAWQEKQGGGANAYRTAVMWGGLKWQSMAMTGVDSQHIEQRRFETEEVCRSFHVLPIMVGQADKAATYASAEQMFLAHIVYTMMPLYARVEQSADINLLSEADLDTGYYTKFIANGLMRGSPKDRADYYTKLHGIGALSPNDIRVLEEFNPVEGGDEYGPPEPAAPAPAPIPSNEPSNKPSGDNDEPE